MTKRCPTCQMEKEEDDFGLCSKNKNGRNYSCRKCINAPKKPAPAKHYMDYIRQAEKVQPGVLEAYKRSIKVN